MKNRGFTLFETLVSTIVFGIIMILMFQLSSSFFKLFASSGSQNSINSKFIKAYTQMQKEFMITDAKYIYSYNNKFNNTYHNIQNKWFVFPVPTDKDGHFQGDGNTFNWKRIFIYYLSCTNSNCSECSKIFQDPNEKLKYCPEKNLIKLTYNYIGSNDKNFFASALYTFCDDINSYTLQYDRTFPICKPYNITEYGEYNIFKYYSKKIVATNILDMIVIPNKKNVKIKLSVVKNDEASKEANYGKSDFTTKEFSKFVNEFEFTINTRNSD